MKNVLTYLLSFLGAIIIGIGVVWFVDSIGKEKDNKEPEKVQTKEITSSYKAEEPAPEPEVEVVPEPEVVRTAPKTEVKTEPKTAPKTTPAVTHVLPESERLTSAFLSNFINDRDMPSSALDKSKFANYEKTAVTCNIEGVKTISAAKRIANEEEYKATASVHHNSAGYVDRVSITLTK